MLATEEIKTNEEVEEIKNNNEFESKKKTNKIIVVVIIVVILMMLMGIFSTAFALINLTNTKILQGISIRGIDVSGLTKEEATNKIDTILNNELAQEIILKHGGFAISLKPEQIDFKYNIEEAVNNAYLIGREGNILENNYKIIDSFMNKLDIPITYTYNDEVKDEIALEIEPQLPDAVKQASYYIENNNIIIISGKEGSVIKRDELITLLLEAIIDKDNTNKTIEIPTEVAKPSLIDVDAFHDMIYVEPKDAYYTKEPFIVYPEVIGIDFNVDEVKQMLQEYQETYTIKLIYTTPAVTKNQIGTEAFPDLLASFSTKYNASDRDRTTNLKLASNKINGVLLMPGEEFSYNQTLGPRTAAAGYKSAKIFSNGEVIDGIGGGICQISSTLYNAVLYANLEITDRRNHQFVTSYLKAGLDATVVYGSQDFKFKNSRKYPIKIISNVSNGVAKIDIFGVKEDVEYEVKLEPVVVQSNSTSLKTVTYKYRYLNGNLVDKVVLSRDTYKRH